MTDAENSLKEQKESVQAVTEPQPTETPKFQLIPNIEIPKKAAAAAKAIGVDLQGLVSFAPVVNDWAASVEQRLDAIIKAIPDLPKATIELLKAEAEKQRAERQQQIQQQPQAQGGTREALMSAAPEIIGAVREALKGGGGDDVLKTLAMESLKADIDFSRSLKSAVLSKFTSKVTADLAESLGAT